MVKLSEYEIYEGSLLSINQGKALITTLNAHSFNVAKTDIQFRDALKNSDYLLPDGISIVWARKFLCNEQITKIAGEDLFFHKMRKLQKTGGRCFFLGSTIQTLKKIQKRATKEFPDVNTGYYSPPFKAEFTKEDTRDMISKVNDFNPDVLFIGLTAPKQEKWAYQNFQHLDAKHICCIGAVFDFYAQNIRRAPEWMIQFGVEWLYRLIQEPGRMWQRYLIGNSQFIWSILKEKTLKRKNT
jgi:N-acetylglucosaminyldiphosphoundecaprenol N-acetyl-beta-D-mannosaminyltransferase